MATPTLERIDLLSYSVEPPEFICAFFWSEATGLTCSDPDYLAELAKTGIATAPAGEPVFPRDGRRFFDALTTFYSGSFLRALTRHPPHAPQRP